MVDPLSISTAAVTFIVTSIKTIQLLFTLFDDIAEAPYAINNLYQELTELRNVFEDLGRLSQSISECSIQTIRNANLTPEFAQQFEASLDKIHCMIRAMHTKMTGKTWQQNVARLQ